MTRALTCCLLLTLLLTACGGEEELLPALTDDSTCEQAMEVVDRAIEEARVYIGTSRDDPFFADQIVFALSAVDERPECFDTDTTSRARGLRSTLAN